MAWEELPEDERTVAPVDMDEYTSASQDDYESYTEESETTFAEAAKADAAGDKFEQATVFLAISLFLAGVASLFRQRRVRYAALTFSAVAIIPGIWTMIDGQQALG